VKKSSSININVIGANEKMYAQLYIDYQGFVI